MKQPTLFDLEAFTNSSLLYPPVYDPAWDYQESPDPELIPETLDTVREQVLPDTLDTVREQRLNIKSAPEHTHWIEEYWVERCGKKYKYWRYCWMEGRKIKRCHLGAVRSQLAKHKKADIEIWIADGLTPVEIKKLIHSPRLTPNS